MKVETNNKVSVEYEGKLDDGSVFDSSEGKSPLQFVVGNRLVIKGFDEAVLGMKEGEEKEFSIEPEEAYGLYNNELIKEVPRDFIPKDKEVKEGMLIALGTPDGRQFPAKIKEVTNAIIKVDLNHPLAGKKLNFKIKVVKIEENTCKTDENKECCGGHVHDNQGCDCEDKKETKKDGSVEDLI